MADASYISLIGVFLTIFVVAMLGSVLIGLLFSKLSQWVKWPIAPLRIIAFGTALVPLILTLLAVTTYLQTTEVHVSQGYGVLYLYPAGLALFAWLVIWPLSYFALRKLVVK